MRTKSPLYLLGLLATLLLSVLASCSPSDPLTDAFYAETVYTWNGTAWNQVQGGAVVVVETDPIFTASPSFGITAANILAWNGHPPLITGVHGVGAGDVVGTTLLQELTGPKTLTDAVGKGTWTASGVWKLPAMYFNGDITTDRWLSTEGNTFLGRDVVGFGSLAHTAGSEGYYNTLIGHHAGNFLSLGSFNTGIGQHVLFRLTSGDGNVGVGALAGHQITSGSYNVALGTDAGPTSDSSYGLFIDMAETDTPLISGNFTEDWVTVNGKLGVGVTPPAAYLHLPAGTAAVNTAPLKMTTGTLLTTPEAGVLEYDGTGIYLTNTNHRRFISQAADSIITPVSVASTNATTTVFTAVLNANELKAHRVYRLSFYGEYSAVNTADTITVRVDVNGTTAVTITSTAGVATDAPFQGECVFTVQSIGVGGNIASHGNLLLNTKTAHTNTSSVAVNTTAINYATLKVKWSDADAGNIFTLDQAFLEVLD